MRAQEEMLRKVQAMADTLDYEALKKTVLPAVHTLCLGTTSGEPLAQPLQPCMWLLWPVHQ